MALIALSASARSNREKLQSALASREPIDLGPGRFDVDGPLKLVIPPSDDPWAGGIPVIRGAGQFSTRLVFTHSDDPGLTIEGTPNGNDSHRGQALGIAIEKLGIEFATASPLRRGDGIYLKGFTQGAIRDVFLTRCLRGLNIERAEFGGPFEYAHSLLLSNVNCSLNYEAGLFSEGRLAVGPISCEVCTFNMNGTQDHSGCGVYGAFHADFRGCRFVGNSTCGARIFGPANVKSFLWPVTFDGACKFESNSAAGLVLTNVPNTTVRGCVFMTSSRGETAIKANGCGTLTVDGTDFTGLRDRPSQRILDLGSEGGGVKRLHSRGNTFYGRTYAVGVIREDPLWAGGSGGILL